MLRHLVIICTVLISLTRLTFAEQTYKGSGFSFIHGDTEKVTVTGEKIKTLRIENADNSLFMVQNYGSSVTPEKLRSMMTESLLKQLGNSALELKHKTASRELFRSPQKGTYILFSKNNIPSESLLFTFEKDGDTICVITQMALQYSKEAERMFASIQNSLSILK